MAILKNKTQKDFTMISNSILRDVKLKMMDRGVLCTLCSLPDGWEFSIAGFAKISPDKETAITNSLKRLEKNGYLKYRRIRNKRGRYETELEVLPVPIHQAGKSRQVNPDRLGDTGESGLDNQGQYNNQYQNNKCKTLNDKSINQSINGEIDGTTEAQYRDLIAKNIDLNALLEVAKTHGDSEVMMVQEIYGVICDMVCFQRKTIRIKDTSYPWETVKSQFLKLRYTHIAAVLNKIIDADLDIKNMQAYLISTLYTQSLIGIIELEASITDDYLKFLRGKPY